jgi:hypothetical protein
MHKDLGSITSTTKNRSDFLNILPSDYKPFGHRTTINCCLTAALKPVPHLNMGIGQTSN